MSVLRVGVIGCGLQGEEQLARLAAIDGVELAAVADLDERRLAQVGDRFGVPERHADALALIDRGLDLVSVCTMPDTHAPFAIAALGRGSHVLCEKPLARSVEEGVEIVRAAERAERLLMVGFTMRCLRATDAVRRFMEDGLLGEPVCAHGFLRLPDPPWWGRHHVRAQAGGGVLASGTVHLVDALMWLAGNPRPLTATASMATLFPRKRAHGAPAGAAEAYDVEDVMSGHVRFEGGYWCSVDGSWMRDRPGPDYGFELTGTRGQAQFDPLELYAERDGVVVEVPPDAGPADDAPDGLALELRAAVESVRAGRVSERLATGREALTVQAVTDALYRSAREQREVAVEVPDV